MDVVSYSELRQHTKRLMDRVVSDRTEMLVTRRDAAPVVLISLQEWNAICGKLHPLCRTRNAARLIRAMHDLDEGKGVKRELI